MDKVIAILFKLHVTAELFAVNTIVTSDFIKMLIMMRLYLCAICKLIARICTKWQLKFKGAITKINTVKKFILGGSICSADFHKSGSIKLADGWVN